MTFPSLGPVGEGEACPGRSESFFQHLSSRYHKLLKYLCRYVSQPAFREAVRHSRSDIPPTVPAANLPSRVKAPSWPEGSVSPCSLGGGLRPHKHRVPCLSSDTCCASLPRAALAQEQRDPQATALPREAGGQGKKVGDLVGEPQAPK